MRGAWLLRIRRALRKDPRYIARRAWLELSMASERWRAPRRVRRFRLDALWRRAGHANLDALWAVLAARPYPHARQMDPQALDALQPGCVATLLARAEQAYAHQVDLLGSGPLQMPPQIDWLVDLKTGRRWPEGFHRDIDYNNFNEPSDVKMAWELSRLQWALPLGQAWLLTGDDRYALKLRELLQQWIAANPYAGSVNWTCTMEPALRILVWTWIFHACAQAPSWRDPGFRDEFLQALYLHGDFVARNLERADINGNHYTADAAGLVYAGLFFDGLGEAARWQRLGWQILESELPRQVFEDGVDFEAAVPDHRLVAELFLYPALYREACTLSVDERYRERVAAMARFTAAYSRHDGSSPLWGDADDGRALAFGVQALNDHRYLVAAAAVCLHNPELTALCSGPRDELAWLLGLPAAQDLPARTEPERPTSEAFRSGGFYIMRAGRHHVFVDCGPLGLAGRGGHGHNDLLAFELMLDGVQLFSDCGAYQYTASPTERNHFRATAQHNTPRVDGHEINRFVRPDYLWVLHNDATHELLEWSSDEARTRFRGRHNGYARLPDPVRVTRELVLEHRTGRLILEDNFEAAQAHQVQTPFHAAPGVRIELQNDDSALLHAQGRRFLMRWDGSAGWRARRRDGRVSPSYGRVEPVDVLEFEINGPLQPLRWSLEMLP